MRKLLLLFISLTLATACSDKNAGKPPSSMEKNQNVENDLSLPLPQVPDSLPDRSVKLKYVGEHFWDCMDFNETSKSLNDDFMEQNFSNFIAVLNYIDNRENQKSAIKILLDKAKVNKEALEKIKSIAKLYLAEPDSPLRSDKIYLLFLEIYLSDSTLCKEGETERYAYMREMLQKNRVNEKASNFQYTTQDGKNHNLFDTPTGTEGLILLFYDPTCENCDKTINSMKENKELNNSLQSGKWKVLAVSTKGNKEDWQNGLHIFPKDWTVGFENGKIEEEETYWLPALPSIYVLSKDFVVIDKDVLKFNEI